MKIGKFGPDSGLGRVSRWLDGVTPFRGRKQAVRPPAPAKKPPLAAVASKQCSIIIGTEAWFLSEASRALILKMVARTGRTPAEVIDSALFITETLFDVGKADG